VLSYRSDIRDAEQRLASLESVLAGTGRGEIEYLDYGDGPPVLVVHGVVGGCDHGPQITRSYLGDGFRSIAVSRFGYLRSPLTSDPSPEAQADLYAALLDELGIGRAGVIGTSAGTSSALQFALRHPKRCAALALFSIAVGPYHAPSTVPLAAIRAYFGSNLLFWATMNFSGRLTRRLMGIPRHYTVARDDTEFVQELKRSFLPVSRRVPGIINDICISNPGMNSPGVFSGIQVPVLIAHSSDDPWGDVNGARTIADYIPTAEFVEIPSGGHLLLGHRRQMRARFSEFLRANVLPDQRA
jgi:2-hydroxy-6-oxonona-2,4-dienedioate hydrolase